MAQKVGKFIALSTEEVADSVSASAADLKAALDQLPPDHWIDPGPYLIPFTLLGFMPGDPNPLSVTFDGTDRYRAAITLPYRSIIGTRIDAPTLEPEPDIEEES
jgi:hypothetical protein